MKILDLSAGNRAVWFEKNHPDCIYVDLREQVRPTIVCDTRRLPFADGTFDLVVFDPPHTNFGKNGLMSATYGWHTMPEIRDIIAGTAKEAHRVSKTEALMAFKWSNRDMRLGPILALMQDHWQVLFGHSVAARPRKFNSEHISETFWSMLLRNSVPPIFKLTG